MLLRKALSTNNATITISLLALALGIGWATRELAHAQEGKLLKAQTLHLAGIKAQPIVFDGTTRGQLALYFQGATPSARSFVVGQARLDPGKEPHPVHTHPEEEVLIVTAGKGEIICDGKKTDISSGSVMYTSPNAPHGIKNTGSDPLTFYFVKWVGADTHK
jgi:mannose-6-phosphate isomerase-like protein (cupin superfamily)